MQTFAVVRELRRRWRVVTVVAASGAALVTGVTVVAALEEPAPTARWSLFTGADTSQAVLAPDQRPVEVGVRFEAAAAGTVEAVRFLKAPGDTGPHQVSVWGPGGRRLVSATAGGETESGWQQVKLPEPVRVRKGRSYTVSYHTSRFMATSWFFTRDVSAGPLRAGTFNGVYRYGPSIFPNQSHLATNYWVDLVFATAAGATPSPTSAAPSASPTPTATPTAGPTVSPSPTGGPGLDLPRIPWEGGPAYYRQWPAAKAWTDPAFFPIAVWYEAVVEPDHAPLDQAAGLNTYVELTESTDMALIRGNGMYAMPSGPRRNLGGETVAWLTTDEADMFYGPGWDPWNGQHGWNTCIPIQDQGGRCGYTVMKTVNDRLPSDGRPRYANYAKGIQLWETDEQAAVFVNQFQHIISTDMYFYTDPNLQGSGGECVNWLKIPADKCQRAANYGRMVDRVRMLDGKDGKRQATWNFVEVGWPFTEAHAPTIDGNEIAGAVMNSLIHEARGIIYFNHSFGGPCHSQHVLRDQCGATVRPKVTETNQRIAALARVLNTQSYQWVFNAGLDTMLKASGGSYYVFAMPSRDGGTGSQTLTLPAGISAGGGRAEVMFENRTVPISGGRFTDTFAAEYSYHIYKITP